MRPQGSHCDLGAYELSTSSPGPGRNLRITTGSIDLSWDGGTAQTGYYLLRYNTGTTAADLIPLAGNLSSYSDAAAVNGTVYCYVLAAMNGGSVLGLSDLLCGLTGISSGSAVPGGFALTLKQTASATMTWTPPAGGVGNYLLQRIPLDGTPISSGPLGTGVTSTTQAVTSAGTCFQLIAYRVLEFGTTNVLCGAPGVSTLSAGGRVASLDEVTEAMAALAGRVKAAAVFGVECRGPPLPTLSLKGEGRSPHGGLQLLAPWVSADRRSVANRPSRPPRERAGERVARRSPNTCLPSEASPLP